MTKIISFEGIDGVGKTTQLRLLSASLTTLGIQHLVTQELSGDEIRNSFRQVLMQDLSPMEELSLISLARQYHMRKIIEPALKKGKLVLIDRFIDSTYAYQGGGRGVPMAMIALMEHNMWNTPKPDLVIYLDRKPMEILKQDRFETQDSSFFKRVQAVYQSRIDKHWLHIQEDEVNVEDRIYQAVLDIKQYWIY